MDDPFYELRKQTQLLFKQSRGACQAAELIVRQSEQVVKETIQIRDKSRRIKAEAAEGMWGTSKSSEQIGEKTLTESHLNGSISGHSKRPTSAHTGHKAA